MGRGKQEQVPVVQEGQDEEGQQEKVDKENTKRQ